MTRVLIIGATSAIAAATARRYAGAGADLFLVGRSEGKLDALRADLAVRGAGRVRSHVLDVLDTDRHPEMLDAAASALGSIDRVLIAHGSLPDQKECEASVAATLHALQVNCLSAISLLTLLANRFEAQKHGRIAVITSVAGDRGRQSNYVYGTAKSALDTFLQGLRNRLHPAGVTVLTIKPGFVDTPMTAGLPKNPLFADPERVGQRIWRAMEGSGDVLYVPGYWRAIMAGIRSIPEPIFKRLRL